MVTLLLVLGLSGVLWGVLKVVDTLVRPWLQHRSPEGQYGPVLGNQLSPFDVTWVPDEAINPCSGEVINTHVAAASAMEGFSDSMAEATEASIETSAAAEGASEALSSVVDAGAEMMSGILEGFSS